MIVVHYSTPAVAQRKKDSMDAAERSGIAKGIPQGTLPSSPPFWRRVRIRASHARILLCPPQLELGLPYTYAFPWKKMT